MDLQNKQKEFLTIDKNQIIYDEAQIDYINEHQSKIYISQVEINPFLKFGIRTHFEELTFAHCIHSMFRSVWHKDILLIWGHFMAGLFSLWQLIALQLGINHYYDFPRLSTGYVLSSMSLLIITSWFFVKAIYYLFYCMSY
jgi:hypothetical protein